jgi:peptidoglycan-N-acetylglucosamine deacetylase
VVRSQTLLVVAVIGLVIWLASNPAVSGDSPATPFVTPVPTTVAPTVEPTTGPTATVASTAEPTATEAPTEEPTQEPTEEPVATERPEPPDTGQDSSLIVEYGTSGRLEVALTFDAGEGAGHTGEILDLLADHGLVGSFGVTGQWAEQNPELLQRMVAEGHQVINHTYDHRSYTGKSTQSAPMTADEFREEVTRTEAIIEDVTGGYVSKPFFRFPYGDYDQSALDLLGEMGYSYTMWWSCDTQGWNGYTPDEIVDLCGPDNEEKGGEGAIILMHVADDNDWEALESLIEAYADEGYDFVTLEQIIQP